MIIRINRPKEKKGFSLIEMIIVVAVIAVLAAIAVMAFDKLIPSFELRTSARSAVSLMQQARLLAANTQKPIRAVIDCRPRENAPPGKVVPCMAVLYMAQFDPNNNGELMKWVKVNGDGVVIGAPYDADAVNRYMGSSVNIDVSTSGGAPVRPAGSPNHLFWAVFFPSGRLAVSHSPMRLEFTSKTIENTWEVFLSETAGRTTLRKTK